LAALTGDDELADDVLLADVPDVLDAARELLLDRGTALDDVADALAAVDDRWRRRAADRALDEREREVLGALGFCALTQRMLRHTSESWSGQLRDDDRDRLVKDLDAIFQRPEVKKAFADLYDFPATLRLGSAALHALGTTSFILHCWTNEPGPEQPRALKCILYRYTQVEAVALGIKNYKNPFPKRDQEKEPYPAIAVSVESISDKWVRMEFIDGKTLADEVPNPPSGTQTTLNVARLRRYGLPLVNALRLLPFPHLDLSPSNIMVRRRDLPPGDNGSLTAVNEAEASLVLIDFGQNYLLTDNVAGGRVSRETARYVAPELLASRAKTVEPSGYEDLYSLGQILVELGGYGQADAGHIPEGAYQEAPLFGRFVEDLIDQDPTNRLLLGGGDWVPTIDGRRRREMYMHLYNELAKLLRAHESLARTTPTLTPRPAAGDAWYQRLSATLADRFGSLTQLPAMALDMPVAKPLKMLKVLRTLKTGDDLAADFRSFSRWATICTVGWAVIWVTSLKYIHDEAPLPPFPPPWHQLLVAHYPFVNLSALVHPYSQVHVDWPTLPARLVALTFGVTVTKYYLEIFSMLGVGRVWKMSRAPGLLVTAGLTRLMALGVVLVLLANWRFTQHWLLFWGAGMLFVVANNYANYRTASGFVREGREVFSTIRNSELHQSVATYAEWWKLMLAYGAGIAWIDVMIDIGLAGDFIMYAIIVMAANLLILYRGNCGTKAPWLRATLARAFVTGERLEARKRRLAASPPIHLRRRKSR
jgi:serine/threonine protein kinase